MSTIIPQCAWCVLLTGERHAACTDVHGTKTCADHVRLAMEMSYGKSYLLDLIPELKDKNG